MLLSQRCALVADPGPGPGDFIVRGEDFGLFAVVGTPPLEPLACALDRHRGKAVLCAPELGERAAQALPGWFPARAVIHRLAGAQASASTVRPGVAEPRLGMLSPRDSGALAHVPASLKEELVTALGFTHLAAAFVEDRPVSFCYAVYETETLWDISIDTLENYRGRGLAGACCRFLIDHMARHGKEPVWGALEQNVASRKMAEALGFTPVDELTVFERGAPR